MIIPFGFLRKVISSTFDFTTGLVASWQFESNFLDYTSNNHDATAVGTVTFSADGVVGKRAVFDGSTDYLTVPDSDDFSFTDGVSDVPFTLCAWVNFNSVSNCRFLSKLLSAGDLWEWTFGYNGTSITVACYHFDSSANRIKLDYPWSPTTNTWYHLVVTYDGSETKEGLKLYLDGTEVSPTLSEGGTYTGMTNRSHPLHIGTNSGFVSQSLNGRMDEVKIYKNRELTQAEVTEMHTLENAAISVFTSDFLSGLVASWQFESNFLDYTVNNHDATAVGTVTNTTGGIIGNSAKFDGSADYLTVPDHNDFSFTDGVNDVPFTLCLWVKFDVLGAFTILLGKRDGSTTDREYEIYLNTSGDLGLQLLSPTNSPDNRISISQLSAGFVINTWYHIAFTYDGSETKEGLSMYIDSVSVGTLDSLGTYTGMTGSTSLFAMGSSVYNTALELDGKLDEVKVYKNRKLTQADITEMYTLENAGTGVLP
tara:strand:+ start:22435 stop:23877 length:1443 start_codon:yes stop_codon:yes gene_type:complete